MCGNSTNCITLHSQSVPSTGCFLDWLKLSASVCCRIEVSTGVWSSLTPSIVTALVTLLTLFPRAPDI